MPNAVARPSGVRPVARWHRLVWRPCSILFIGHWPYQVYWICRRKRKLRAGHASIFTPQIDTMVLGNTERGSKMIRTHEDWESTVSRPPYLLAWESSNHLPERRLKPRGRRPQLPFYLSAPPHFATGPADAAFDFSSHMLRLCSDIAAWCEELQKVDV